MSWTITRLDNAFSKEQRRVMHVFTAVHWKLQETGPDSCNELLDADFLDKVKMSIS